MNIGVVGIWHLGETFAAGLASLGHSVIGFDADEEIILNLEKGILPIAEPSVREAMQEAGKNGRLEWSSNPSAVENADAVFLTVDTPLGDDDISDASVLFDLARQIAPHMRRSALFAVVSQVAVGTTHALAKLIRELNPSWHGQAAYVPENLQLGEAWKSFFHPERMVIGVDAPEAADMVEKIYCGIACPRLQMSIVSAELAKHALNAFLAVSLGFIYNISDMSEAVGADITDISKALKSDPRIGHAAYLDSSLGFSGGTLMRELTTLSSLSEQKGRPMPLISATLFTNRNRRQRMVQRLEALARKPLTELRVGIVGLTYKPGTPTLRRSMALEIIALLRQAGASVAAFDPFVDSNEFERTLGEPMKETVYDMARGCHALVLLTVWPELAELDWHRLIGAMSEPFIFYDTRNFLMNKEAVIRSAGFKYAGVGR